MIPLPNCYEEYMTKILIACYKMLGYPDSVVFAEYKVTVDDKHTEILTSKLSSQSWEGNKVSSTSSVNFPLSYP